ncbi:hypothetical protein CEXT_509191 [Caerostris extrusa]|uniref:Uncharacterized protein n=1 Tax=Caerostris extrusa TaxID=172846 RepID=A0AAV4WRQ9_CAEEX|nr:hypothetical protein CEXT_509191 [Caerostris extrusa]
MPLGTLRFRTTLRLNGHASTFFFFGSFSSFLLKIPKRFRGRRERSSQELRWIFETNLSRDEGKNLILGACSTSDIQLQLQLYVNGWKSVSDEWMEFHLSRVSGIRFQVIGCIFASSEGMEIDFR